MLVHVTGHNKRDNFLQHAVVNDPKRRLLRGRGVLALISAEIDCQLKFFSAAYSTGKRPLAVMKPRRL